jgi:hypothetical protein
MIEGACHCGAVHWRFDGVPEAATACNCTMCRRLGALWAYDYEGERITVSGPTRIYVHGDRSLGVHFCGECGCIAYWRGTEPGADGRRRMGFNLRLAEPDAVGDVPINRLDGFETWTRAPSNGRRVADVWF